MKVYKLHLFARWAKKEGVTNTALKQAVAEIESGLYEANLGEMVYKKRIARKGCGKRGGYRTLLAFKLEDKAIFLYGFAKKDRENISTKDEQALKKLAAHYMAASPAIIQKAVVLNELEEIK